MIREILYLSLANTVWITLRKVKRNYGDTVHRFSLQTRYSTPHPQNQATEEEAHGISVSMDKRKPVLCLIWFCILILQFLL